MRVVGGMAPMMLETLRSMRLVHRVETTRGTEYHVTLADDPPTTDTAALTSTSVLEPPQAISSLPRSWPPPPIS